MTTEEIKLVESSKPQLPKQERIDNFISNFINVNSDIITQEDTVNIMNIYTRSVSSIKDQFDNEVSNNISDWTLVDWIKLIHPVITAIERYNKVNKKGEYKKLVAILIMKCVIEYEIDISDESKIIIQSSIDLYLGPAIDSIVLIANNVDFNSLFKRCFPCCFT